MSAKLQDSTGNIDRYSRYEMVRYHNINLIKKLQKY